MSVLPRYSPVDISVLPSYSPVDISVLCVILRLICRYLTITVRSIYHACVLPQSCCERIADLRVVHRSFCRELNLCCARLVCSVTSIFFKLIHDGQERKRINLSVKQKLELIEKLESAVYVAHMFVRNTGINI
jgi:hypothetical protein